MTICVLECVGLVSDVVKPGRRAVRERENEERRLAA
jgi:hypothetical protein